MFRCPKKAKWNVKVTGHHQHLRCVKAARRAAPKSGRLHLKFSLLIPYLATKERGKKCKTPEGSLTSNINTITITSPP